VTTLSYGGFANQLAQGAALNNAFGNIDTENPDLTAFSAAGGKMLSYHGLADPLVPQALSSNNYYEKVSAVVGGYSETQKFYRLFLVPGWATVPASIPKMAPQVRLQIPRCFRGRKPTTH
jgi:feruloyl esterase